MFVKFRGGPSYQSEVDITCQPIVQPGESAPRFVQEGSREGNLEEARRYYEQAEDPATETCESCSLLGAIKGNQKESPPNMGVPIFDTPCLATKRNRRLQSHVQFRNMAVGQNQWYHFGVGAPPILEPILVVGLGCSLGVRFGF